VGCPIRTSTDQRLLAAPRGFSQRATSFLASWCQGIHRMPFSRSRSTARPLRTGPPPTMHRSQPHRDIIPPRRPATWQATNSAHTRDPTSSHRPCPNAAERLRRTARQHAPTEHATGQTPRPRHVQRRTRTIFTLTKTTPSPTRRPNRITHPGQGPHTAPPATRHHRQAGQTTPNQQFHRETPPPQHCHPGNTPGGDRIRTDDPLLAKQVLSQLSYAPARAAPARSGTRHSRPPNQPEHRPARPTRPPARGTRYGPGRT
jgi:hypothetical protein